MNTPTPGEKWNNRDGVWRTYWNRKLYTGWLKCLLLSNPSIDPTPKSVRILAACAADSLSHSFRDSTVWFQGRVSADDAAAATSVFAVTLPTFPGASVLAHVAVL